MPSSAQAGFKLIMLPISPTNCVGVGLSWAELSSVISLGVGSLEPFKKFVVGGGGWWVVVVVESDFSVKL